MSLTPAQQKFLEVAGKASLGCEASTEVPAALTLAQAIFESGWGAKAPGENYFGIKANGRGNGTQVLMTTEYVNGKSIQIPQRFETYASMELCFDDHAWLLAHGAPYATAWAAYQKSHDFDAFVLAIGPVYATSKSYGASILAFAKSSTIQDAITAARAEALTSAHGKLQPAEVSQAGKNLPSMSPAPAAITDTQRLDWLIKYVFKLSRDHIDSQMKEGTWPA